MVLDHVNMGLTQPSNLVQGLNNLPKLDDSATDIGSENMGRIHDEVRKVKVKKPDQPESSSYGLTTPPEFPMRNVIDQNKIGNFLTEE